ncbi:hypothetical protein COX95_03870 [bacterium CG_4_10_14_0_2_um_filter_33_32]|nr:MAG: hypothetical protein AUJ93_00455 [bacterium CG2_30_33_46]PIU76818.1 MAG: hypothetical protein COS74_02075 [bacterium CG06_land_8_20_14_3_00_33_50]PIW81618.1 MAG: hypothetical protein COZ97_00850 [bacterium CG_4_8_14_3_um_filter_33_28]PIY85524.1 MAG: hypothetical protein COY76_01705 [bacterium CG_4_10_14_0_8_um_filter_33_57]PIZ85503.1 MAG: hypothetical protein COX95_03870 [bacterium CG_4_10_14_0_2_um_filter_33_32]PJA72368.1 MAG: hypothetical protein CO152_01910 [bacterium CG_4_9_14_3_um
MKKYLGIIVLLIIFIAASITLAFFSNAKEWNKNNSGDTKEETQQKKPPATTASEKGVILFFYSNYCSWCQKEKPIVQELEKEGVKFKYMDVGENRNLLSQYSVEGTPTFILNDKRLVGYKPKEDLLKFWQDNK